MYSLKVDSIVESVLSPEEDGRDLRYIYDSKSCDNEVDTVNVSRHIAVIVLYRPEYLIFIWNWDFKGMYVDKPLSYIARTT